MVSAAGIASTAAGDPCAAFFAAARSAGASSLVKGSKSPTPIRGAVSSVKTRRTVPALAELEQVAERIGADVKTDGTRARLAYRWWSGEYKIQLEADTRNGAPPDNSGDRVTYRLSDRGATALGEACEFVTREQGGFTTFLTLTLDAAARERIERRVVAPRAKQTGATVHRSGRLSNLPQPRGRLVGELEAAGPWCPVRWAWESSVQREVSRFLDAATKMYARGWVPPYWRRAVVTIQRGPDRGAQYTPIRWNTSGRKVPGFAGLGDRLAYAWVCEAPANADGEENPHVHMLLRWRVPFAVFPAWARRLERLWGQGFAHLERLRAAEAAGYYIAKAAGYLAKGTDGDQGRVRGNRYGIAREARAPGWEPLIVWAWGALGHLLAAAREKWRERVAPLRATRDKAKEALQAAKRGTGARQKIARRLMQTRRQIAELPVFGRWRAVFRSEDSVDRFLGWAERQGWDPTGERPPGLWLGEFLRRQRAAAERRIAAVMRFTEDAWRAAIDFYERFEPVGLESCQ